MIAGLPLGAWVLLGLAVGAGLALQGAAWWAHRRDAPGDDVPPAGRGPEDGRRR